MKPISKRKRIITCVGLLVMVSWFGWIRDIENAILDWYEGVYPTHLVPGPWETDGSMEG